MPSGQECTVSLRDLAPCGEANDNDVLQSDEINDSPKNNSRCSEHSPNKSYSELNVNIPASTNTDNGSYCNEHSTANDSPKLLEKQCVSDTEPSQVRRSGRERKAPVKLDL